MEPSTGASNDESVAGHLRQAKRGHREAMEGAANHSLGWLARVLRQAAARVADGLELPLRHRPSSRADFHIPASDGIDGPANLRTKRRRTLEVQEAACRLTPENCRSTRARKLRSASTKSVMRRS